MRFSYSNSNKSMSRQLYFFEENDRTYMHISTICKCTVSPELFIQELRSYFWGITLAHLIYVWY